MYFASDNAGPVHPAVMDALAGANEGYAKPYGADPLSARVQAQIRDIFDAPDAQVLLVGNGTVANSLLLGAMVQPWQTVYCAARAHIQMDECGAPEFFSGGAKLTPLGSSADKIAPEELRTGISASLSLGLHGVAPGALSLTQATESGTVYALDEIRSLSAIATAHDLPVHMDGARFANALAHLRASPAEMTWQAGVQTLSFGGTKNGLMGVEAMISFAPETTAPLERLRKRGGQLFSKHRFLAAQMNAYLTDGLWLDLAERANTAAAELAEGLAAAPDVELLYPVQSNIVFARWPRALHQRLQAAGAQYYVWNDDLEGADPDAPLVGRLVCDWSSSAQDRQEFLRLLTT